MLPLQRKSSLKPCYVLGMCTCRRTPFGVIYKRRLRGTTQFLHCPHPVTRLHKVALEIPQTLEAQSRAGSQEVRNGSQEAPKPKAASQSTHRALTDHSQMTRTVNDQYHLNPHVTASHRMFISCSNIAFINSKSRKCNRLSICNILYSMVNHIGNAQTMLSF